MRSKSKSGCTCLGDVKSSRSSQPRDLSRGIVGGRSRTQVSAPKTHEVEKAEVAVPCSDETESTTTKQWNLRTMPIGKLHSPDEMLRNQLMMLTCITLFGAVVAGIPALTVLAAMDKSTNAVSEYLQLVTTTTFSIISLAMGYIYGRRRQGGETSKEVTGEI